MKSALRLALVAAALSAAGAAVRADDGIAAAPQRVEIVAPRSPDAVAQAVRWIDQHYRMDNGRRMTLVGDGHAVQMRYGTRPERAMTPAGDGRWVSADGRLALRFELDGRGEPTITHLSMPASWQ